MRNQDPEEDIRSRVRSDTPEEWLRGCIRHAVQDFLKEEVSELLGQGAITVNSLYRLPFSSRLHTALIR